VTKGGHLGWNGDWLPFETYMVRSWPAKIGHQFIEKGVGTISENVVKNAQIDGETAGNPHSEQNQT